MAHELALGRLFAKAAAWGGWALAWGGSALTMDCAGLQTVIDCQGPKHNRLLEKLSNCLLHCLAGAVRIHVMYRKSYDSIIKDSYCTIT